MQEQGRVPEAINYLKQAINENKSFCLANFKLGSLYFEQHEYTKSLDEYKKAGKGACYGSPLPPYYEALTHIKLKDFSNAKTKLKEVVMRFSLTKYERMAHKKLQALNHRMDRIEQNPMILENGGGKNLTPDF